MIKYLLTGCCVLLLLTTAFAGDDAGQETPFSVGAGARALGMGGGFISLSNDASAVFYNPAGLPRISQQELSLMHMDLFEGTIYDYAGWVYPDPKLGGFGLAIMRIGTDDIVRRVNFIDQGTFDYSYTQYLISYGKQLQGGVSIGLNFKIVNQTLDSLSDYGLGFDVGILSTVYKNLQAGMVFRDMVPPEIELGAKSESSPLTLAGGLALNDFYVDDNVSMTASFELEKVENRAAKLHTGIELGLMDTYFMRGGYDRDNVTFGAGLNYRRLKIDYAYKVLDYIEDSHRFSFSLMIGASVAEKQQREENRIAQQGQIQVEDERKRQFEFYRDKAYEYQQKFMLDSALAYYQRALAFDEHNTAIIGTIAGIEKSIRIQQETELELQKSRDEMLKTTNTYLTQAQNFFDKKYYNAALDMLQLIFDINPGHPEAMVMKLKVEDGISAEIAARLEDARLAEKESRYFNALEAYNRILELSPDNQIARDGLTELANKVDIAQQLNQGIGAYNDQQFDVAKSTFEAVLSIDPNNPVAIEYLKKIDVDEEKTTTLEELQRDKAIWQKYLDGLRFMRNKEYEKAIDAWNAVLKVYPNNVNTLNNIEQARLRLRSEQSE